MITLGLFNVVVVVLILAGVVAVGVWAGWRLSQVNTRQHGLVVASNRDVAVNDEAANGEFR